MDMVGYLSEMRFAVEQVLDGLWKEREHLRQLEADVARLTRATEQGYRQAAAIAEEPLDADDVMLATGMQFDTYFGVDKERHGKGRERDALNARVQTLQFSLEALAGTALQYAKQGISVVHGGVGPCPSGRLIGSLALKTVIWQGRNQAVHWEDGSLHPATLSCFRTLMAEQGVRFADHATRSLADDIVALLAWRDVAALEADLMSLA